MGGDCLLDRQQRLPLIFPGWKLLVRVSHKEVAGRDSPDGAKVQKGLVAVTKVGQAKQRCVERSGSANEPAVTVSL